MGQKKPRKKVPYRVKPGNVLVFRGRGKVVVDLPRDMAVWIEKGRK